MSDPAADPVFLAALANPFRDTPTTIRLDCVANAFDGATVTTSAPHYLQPGDSIGFFGVPAYWPVQLLSSRSTDLSILPFPAVGAIPSVAPGLGSSLPWRVASVASPTTFTFVGAYGGTVPGFSLPADTGCLVMAERTYAPRRPA